MSEFKQIEPLPVEIGDELYFDYGNGTAEDGYVHLTSARRAHESTLDYAAAMRLHSTLSRALGLPDVAELQRRVDEAVSYLAQPLMRGYFLPTMPPDLRALVDAARERQEKE